MLALNLNENLNEFQDKFIRFQLVSGFAVYIATISSMADFEPKINANTPKMQTIIFLKMTQLHGPNPSSQYVTNSMATWNDSFMLIRNSCGIDCGLIYIYRNE